ncbi:MAG: recombination mediator RecR [Gemmatimonadota bacterium]
MGPIALEDLITAFARLPGIGRKTAQRLALHVLKSPREEADDLAAAIARARQDIVYCTRCRNFTDRAQELCDVCRDARRDPGVICVVEEASDVLVLERSQLIRGTYHVLGGALSPLDGVGPDDLHIDALVQRVAAGGVAEVILALNASAEGEATAEYLHQKLATHTRLTRLARGLPAGSDLDLADKVTLAHALAGRQSF